MKVLNKIIILNILVYSIGWLLGQYSNDYELTYKSILSLHGDIVYNLVLPFKFITHGFMHINFIHLVGNIGIILLGYILFKRIPNKTVWKIYINSVLFSGIVFIISSFFLYDGHVILMGASGGVAGLLGYSLIKYGNIKIIFDIKIKYLLIIFILIDISALLLDSTENLGTSLAHISGLLVGFLTYKEERKSNIDEVY